jgi:glycosyltransferase involved in cell wall biosynthesis
MTPSDTPRLSVLLPVRNGLPWLQSALDGLWRQTFTQFEAVVIEDGSTDTTAALLALQTDPRLRVLATGGVGIAEALNRGLAVARAPFIARHDADDVSHPDRFARQVAYLDVHADVDVVASAADYIGPDGEEVESEWVRTVRRVHDAATSPEEIARLMPVMCCVTHGSVMARTSVLRRAGGYAPDCVPAEDYDLWLRLLQAHRFAKLPERLYQYRVHPEQSGDLNRERQTHEAIRAKLAWLRRVEADLPPGARLAAAGSDAGCAWYAKLARVAGFVPVGPDDDWDVLALTDLFHLDASMHAWLAREPGRARGNFLVRDRVAAALCEP